MSLFTLLAVFVVVGVLLWLIVQFVPMEPTVKRLLVILVCVFLVLWFFSAVFGGFGFLDRVRIGR